MAVLGGDILNYADIQQRLDPRGMPAMVAELLKQACPVVDDIPWAASNLPTSHKSTLRIGLPTVHLRRVNEGVPASKSQTSVIEDGMAMMAAWSHVDAKLLELSGHPEAIRMSEARAFIEAMGQQFEELMWYGSEADDQKEFNGFSVRYDTLGDNVISAGGSGNDLSSIWLVGWGADKVFGIYPQHCLAGLRHHDHKLMPWQESTELGGEVLTAYVDEWEWTAGLVTKDHRFVVRICNIDHAELIAAENEQALDSLDNILFCMSRALHRIPNLSSCRPVFYMPRSILEGFDVQTLRRTTANVFQTKDVQGQAVTTFRGIPMKVSDRLGYAESTIS